MENALQEAMRSLCIREYIQMMLAGVSLSLVNIQLGSTLHFPLASNLCYNTEPINHAVNLGFIARLYFN